MTRRIGLTTLLGFLAALCTAPAREEGAVDATQAAARVTTLQDDRHVVVSRGKLEGLVVGTAVELYPVRAKEEGRIVVSTVVS